MTVAGQRDEQTPEGAAPARRICHVVQSLILAGAAVHAIAVLLLALASEAEQRNWEPVRGFLYFLDPQAGWSVAFLLLSAIVVAPHSIILVVVVLGYQAVARRAFAAPYRLRWPTRVLGLQVLAMAVFLWLL